jgi:multicomponent Na+:H+ antiporter subunit C
MTQVVLALVLGILFGIGTFLMLRRDIVRVVWGVSIVSQSANVYLVTMGGLGGAAPILGGHGAADPAATTDPLVQALVLTAIVIGFGTTALALVLTYRVYQEHGTIDLYDVAEFDAPGAQSNALADGGVAGAERPDVDSDTGADTDAGDIDPDTGANTDAGETGGDDE